MFRKAYIGPAAFALCAILLVPVYAQEILEPVLSEEKHVWNFDVLTIGRVYTVSTPDEVFHVGVLPNVLKGTTDVAIKVFNHTQFEARETYLVNSSATEELSARLTVDWPLPEGKRIVSPVYEFDIDGAADLYDPTKPLWLRVHYPAETNDNKGVYFFDKGSQQWILIPTEINKQDMSLRAAIHLTYAPIAVLADPIAVEGTASWYAYHGCNCAASRDYPHGTLLKLTDVDSQKTVIIEVNDYGPEAWTGRIIDLDLVAFETISNKRKGLTTVIVEPYIPTEEEVESGLPDLFNH